MKFNYNLKMIIKKNRRKKRKIKRKNKINFNKRLKLILNICNSVLKIFMIELKKLLHLDMDINFNLNYFKI